MARPFLKSGITDLEATFDAARSDRATLEVLLHELEFRSVERAVRLRQRVLQALSVLKSSASGPAVVPPPAGPLFANAASPPTNGSSAWDEVKAPLPMNGIDRTEAPAPSDAKPYVRAAAADQYMRKPRPARAYSDRPADILSAWTALEVLSPFTFVKPQDLAEGDERRIARFDVEHPLPWTSGKDKAKPNTQLYYHVVLGAIRMEEATRALLQVFADDDADRRPARGFAGVATVTVTRAGIPIADNAVAISSFAWGLPLTLKRDLIGLGRWPDVERQLQDFVDKRLRRQDENGDPVPLDLATIYRVAAELVERLGLPGAMIEAPGFALRHYQYWKATEPPDPPLLGSFYLGDLALAQTLLTGGNHRNLERYLGKKTVGPWRDVLLDTAVLADALRPMRFPLGRWPSNGRHPLVLLQQAAVNLATSSDDALSLFPVNGPPGTGKTTLLRDLVAALLVRRASAMAAFDDPEDAFSGQKQRAGAGGTHIYTPDETLCGYEMLVASSNNKAVENVSRELPLLKAIADDAPELRYFKTISDRLAGDEPSWGLVAAVLGNSSNRYAFKEAFWNDIDFGLRPYLCEAIGQPQYVEDVDPKTERVIRKRKPEVVVREHPPTSHETALRQWRTARKHFQKVLAAVATFLEAMEQARAEAGRLDALRAQARSAAEQFAQVEAIINQKDSALLALQAATRAASLENANLARQLREHEGNGPSVLAKVFGSRAAKEWDAERRRLTAAVAASRERLTRAESEDRLAQEDLAANRARRTATGQVAERALAALTAAEERVAVYMQRCAARAIDDTFFRRSHGDKHCFAPWLDEEAQRQRDLVFEAAVQVHRAFVTAAAKPVRNNLDALFKTFFGRAAWSPKMQPHMPALWKTLFLTVPVVSTTFASVERMLGFLPPGALGWLLIDEAGQACPQEAVGALIRTKRAIVVGDPLQVEPVTSLPTQLAEAICDDFNVNPDRWNAPRASVQTVADAASSIGATIPREGKDIRVGFPLLVHRRCAEPMFSLSNTVAYGGLMVQATPPRRSRIRDVLGPSRWIDVHPSTTDDKWSEAEGQVVRDLLGRLRSSDVDELSLYIITPFRIVAQRLRERLSAPGVLDRWTDKPWEWARDRIGTVHTVQGREADSVILVLGAPLPSQAGARGWAGSSPNLLNVAVTRAQEALYVVGSRPNWETAGVFGELARHMPVAPPN